MDLRLFIAVELPEEWTVALAETQDALRRRGLARLRWTRPEGIHLTLKFLGNVAEGRVADLAAAMTDAARTTPPFSLRLGELGSFGPPSRPRVVWAAVTGDLLSLTRLWQAVEARIGPLGFPPERERFAPHLTLARVPDELQRDVAGTLARLLAVVPPPAAAQLPVTELALMRSELGREGARYTRLASAPLIANT